MTRTTIAALLATAAPTLALAQAAAPGPAPAPAATPAPIEEIVVTAQLRRETLQAVPLAVTAISGAALSRENIENFADLAKITPGFTAGAAYGFIRNSSMRGISNNQFGFADDPSIAIFTDGVYQGRGGTGSIVNALYDVDRVEILKGPQATLFGRSSIGGAINTILNQPLKGVTEGNAEIGLGERDRVVARGALNLPLADALTLRVAGDYEAQDGYIANRNGGRALQPLEVGAARVALRYEAGPLDVTLRGGFERRRQSGAVYQAVGLPKFVADSNLRGRDAYSNFDIYDGVLRARYSVAAGVSVTSTTSYRSVANRYVEDYDAISTIVGGPYSQQSRDDLFQQDVILNVDKGRFSLVAGGSYFDEWLKGGLPIVGDAPARAQVYSIDVASGARQRIDLDSTRIETIEIAPHYVEWAADGQHYRLFASSADARAAMLLDLDTQTGTVREVIREAGVFPALLHAGGYGAANVALLRGGTQAIWSSQRDGWSHLYLYDIASGRLIRQLTKGPWTVRELLRVDEASAQVYFVASGREGGNPYFRSVYAVGLDGTNLRRLTPEAADKADRQPAHHLQLRRRATLRSGIAERQIHRLSCLAARHPNADGLANNGRWPAPDHRTGGRDRAVCRRLPSAAAVHGESRRRQDQSLRRHLSAERL